MSRTYTRFIKGIAHRETESMVVYARPPEYLVRTYFRVAGKRWALASANWNRAEALKQNQLLCDLAPKIFQLIQQTVPKVNRIMIGPGKPIGGFINQRKRFVYLSDREQKFRPPRGAKPRVRVFAVKD